MTLATVALDCAKRLGRVDANGTAIIDLEDEIKDSIADAIRFYNRQKWALTEFRGFEVTTVASTVWYSTVDLTSGDGDQTNASRTAVDVNTILDIHYLRVDDSNGLDYELKRVAYKDFEELLEGVSPAIYPDVYTIYAGQIGFFPTPDAAYTIYGSGHIKPPIPTSDSDDSVWFTEAEDLIKYAALKRVCVSYLRDTERAAEFGAMETVEANALHGEFVRKTSTGRLKAQW